MKIVLTGARGMLASDLIPCLTKYRHEVIALTKEELDVTDEASVSSVLSAHRPNIVIHPAAYTKVDLAESESDQAFRINGEGTENVARACKQHEVPMLFVSTDYVFDGEKESPYQTNDPTNPLSVYGKSKLAGEQAVMRHLNRFYIVRTSWLYGRNGRNFVETMLNKADQGSPLRVVADQWGCPTSTVSLSEIICDLILTEAWGIHHGTDEGVTTWYEFARAIVQGRVSVDAIETKDFPTPAKRPKYSVLDKSSLPESTRRKLVTWQKALENYLASKQPLAATHGLG
jgi:dTDP-4-dehydrorhamnose reductase